MKKIFVMALLLLNGASALAQAQNFTCEVFGNNNESGELSLSGSNPFLQEYTLRFRPGYNQPERIIKGKLHLLGKVNFQAFGADTQTEIMRVIRSSRHPGVKAGDSVWYGNTQDPQDSTLNIYMMPSGQIVYIEVGVVSFFCS